MAAAAAAAVVPGGWFEIVSGPEAHGTLAGLGLNRSRRRKRHLFLAIYPCFPRASPAQDDAITLNLGSNSLRSQECLLSVVKPPESGDEIM